MSWLSRNAKKIDKARRDVQNALTGGASDRIGDALGNAGLPTSVHTLIDRSLGSRNRGTVGFNAAGKTRPKLATGSKACNTPGGEIAGKPYTFAPMVNLAAGAKALATDLGDFLDAASSYEVTADNFMPWDYVIESAQLVVGVNVTAVSTVENAAAILGQAVLIFREHDIEKARWPLLQFNPIVNYLGVGSAATTGLVVCDTAQLEYDPVEFDEPIVLLEGKKYHFEIQINGITVTTVEVIQLAMIFAGYRV